MGKCYYDEENPGDCYSTKNCPYGLEIECQQECMEIVSNPIVEAIMNVGYQDCFGCKYEEFRNHNPINNCWLDTGKQFVEEWRKLFWR